MDQHVVYLPIKMLVSMPSRVVDVHGRWFELLRTTTNQPNLEWIGDAAAKPLDPMKDAFLPGIYSNLFVVRLIICPKLE